MKTSQSYVLAILFTAIVAGAGGWFLGSQSDRSRIQDLENESAMKGNRIRVLEDMARLHRDSQPEPILEAPGTGVACLEGLWARREPERRNMSNCRSH